MLSVEALVSVQAGLAEREPDADKRRECRDRHERERVGASRALRVLRRLHRTEEGFYANILKAEREYEGRDYPG